MFWRDLLDALGRPDVAAYYQMQSLAYAGKLYR